MKHKKHLFLKNLRMAILLYEKILKAEEAYHFNKSTTRSEQKKKKIFANHSQVVSENL